MALQPNPVGITGTLPTDTAKKYAKRAASRVLPGWVNDTLKAAAKGEEVDVWVFDRAVLQALSSYTHRNSQSMGRREDARQARHLLYWSQAKLEAALRGLPPIEPGARSPRIAELESYLSDADHRIQDLEAKLSSAARLSDAKLAAALRDLPDAREEDQRVLEYALELLTPEQRAQVNGYRDGYRDGTFPA